ncbi:MAG: DUF2380 domain-containing protein [Anaerolineales bacterium]
MTGAAGALALVQSFDPSGVLLSSQGSAATPYGFTGEWGDASGLLDLRARYYLPQAGIFTSRDPFPGFTTLPVTLQPYLYAAGNPLRYTDPSGNFIDTVIDIAFIGYDVYSLVKHINSGCGISKEDLLALGLDVGSALLPFVTGLGMVARVGAKTDDAIKLAGKLDDLENTVRLLPKPKRINYPWHHIFPQEAELAARFANAGIDIDKHLVELPLEIHKKIHRGPGGGLWNEAWKAFFEIHPNANAQDIYKYAGWLIHEFSLEDVIRLIK